MTSIRSRHMFRRSSRSNRGSVPYVTRTAFMAASAPLVTCA
jgi:hypothetical protein